MTGLTVSAKKSNRDNQECNSRVTKYLRLVSPPLCLSLSVSICLSASLMRFHENGETEQVGVVAPGVGTTKPNREEAALEDSCYLCLSSPSTARQFKARLLLVALHVCKQINTSCGDHRAHARPETCDDAYQSRVTGRSDANYSRSIIKSFSKRFQKSNEMKAKRARRVTVRASVALKVPAFHASNKRFKISRGNVCIRQPLQDSGCSAHARLHGAAEIPFARG